MAFIIPSIAMASWWNPFSWKVFHKKEIVPQVQAINTESINNTTTEQINNSTEEIKKLQKQIDDLKKQQPVSASTVTAPTVKKEVKKIIPIVGNLPDIKTENFNEKSLISIKGALIELQAFEKGIDITIQEIDKRNKVVLALLNYENEFVDNNPGDFYSKAHGIFLKAFNDDINKMTEYKNYFTSLKGFATYYYPSFNNIISTYPGLFITKERSIEDIQSYNKVLARLEQINTDSSKTITAYNEYALKTDTEYKKSFQMMLNKLEADKGSYSNTIYYAPPTTEILPIKLPQTTNCSVKYLGSGTSSIECSTY